MAYTIGLSKSSSGYAPLSGGYASSTLNASSVSGSSCGCTDDSTTPIDSTYGLSAINSPSAYPLVIDQGVAFDQKLCLTSGDISQPATNMSAGPNATLTFPITQEICVQVGDRVRVLGLDICTPDEGEIYTVAAVVNTDVERSITFTNLNNPGGVAGPAKVYKQVTTSTSETVLGCIGISVASNNTAGPRIIQHMPADPKFTITGGITYRSDWSQSVGIEFASGNPWIMSRILGLVKPGDTLISDDAGITTPVAVLEVRQVGTSAGATVEKIRLATPPATTGCFLSHIRRGRLATFGMSYDVNGCIDIKLPAAATAGLQLMDSWRVNDDDMGSCGVFNIGCYSIAMHWTQLNAAGQAQNFSRVVLRGDAYIRATHIFENGM